MATADATPTSSSRGTATYNLLLVADTVFQACISHAYLHKAEVQCLLYGNLQETEAGAGAVQIWSMQKHVKRCSEDFLEMQPEELAAAQQEAEAFGEQAGKPTRVLGWFVSRTTSGVPLEEDLEQQLEYQEQFSRFFVGLCLRTTLWERDLMLKCDLKAFRAAEEANGGASQVPVQVQIVQQCTLIPQVPKESAHELRLEPLAQRLHEAAKDLRESSHSRSKEAPEADVVFLSFQSSRRRFAGLSSLLQNEVQLLQNFAGDWDHNMQVLAGAYERKPPDMEEDLPDRAKAPPGKTNESSIAEKDLKSPASSGATSTGCYALAKRISGPAVTAEAEMTWQDKASREASGSKVPSAGEFSARSLHSLVDQSRASSGLQGSERRAPAKRSEEAELSEASTILSMQGGNAVKTVPEAPAAGKKESETSNGVKTLLKRRKRTPEEE